MSWYRETKQNKHSKLQREIQMARRTCLLLHLKIWDDKSCLTFSSLIITKNGIILWKLHCYTSYCMWFSNQAKRNIIDHCLQYIQNTCILVLPTIFSPSNGCNPNQYSHNWFNHVTCPHMFNKWSLGIQVLRNIFNLKTKLSRLQK